MRAKTVTMMIMIAIVLSSPAIAQSEIDYLPAPVVIDGAGSDWAWGQVAGDKYTYPAYCFLGNVDAESADIGLPVVKFGRDTTNFFGYIEVTDENIVPSNSWSDWRKGDALIIGWSPTGKNHPVVSTDRLIIIRPVNGCLRIMNNLSTETLTVSTGQAVMTTKTGGWAVEFRVPFSELGLPNGSTKPGFAVVQRDVDTGIRGFSALGTTQHSAYVAEGPNFWGEVTLATGPAPPLVIGGKDVKHLPDNLLATAYLGWPVIAVGDGFFYCENPDRTAGIKVVWDGEIRTHYLIHSVTGSFQTSGAEREFVASSVEVLESGLFFLPGAFGMNTKSLGGGGLGLGPSNLALRVKVAGIVQEVNAGNFTLFDGGRTITVLSDTTGLLPGMLVVVTGASSSMADTAILVADEIENLQQGVQSKSDSSVRPSSKTTSTVSGSTNRKTSGDQLLKSVSTPPLAVITTPGGEVTMPNGKVVIVQISSDPQVPNILATARATFSFYDKTSNEPLEGYSIRLDVVPPGKMSITSYKGMMVSNKEGLFSFNYSVLGLTGYEKVRAHIWVWKGGDESTDSFDWVQPVSSLFPRSVDTWSGAITGSYAVTCGDVEITWWVIDSGGNSVVSTGKTDITVEGNQNIKGQGFGQIPGAYHPYPPSTAVITQGGAEICASQIVYGEPGQNGIPPSKAVVTLSADPICSASATSSSISRDCAAMARADVATIIKPKEIFAASAGIDGVGDLSDNEDIFDHPVSKTEIISGSPTIMNSMFGHADITFSHGGGMDHYPATVSVNAGARGTILTFVYPYSVELDQVP